MFWLHVKIFLTSPLTFLTGILLTKVTLGMTEQTLFSRKKTLCPL
ncbi:hypothetical protein VCJ_000251 [Vibrio metoecus]|nr:hypothetical protein VCJ_000251 [Vibrio metoecus]